MRFTLGHKLILLEMLAVLILSLIHISRSPFLSSIIFILFMAFLLPGVAYGKTVGTITN